MLAAMGLSTLAGALALGFEGDAKACGGCFHPPTQVASDITDERMLLSVSPQQTTLYDQIRYSGNPSSFAWVLPIHGTVDVGLSADVLFDSVDSLTATQIQAPATNCAPPPSCGSLGGSASASFADEGASPGVTVTKAENVGPYATVQLHSTSSGALEKWLADNAFEIPANVKPIIDQYVKEGFDFLAMKLLPNQGVQAMRPVRVTAPGASLSLPLRMAAIGTGATVGITVWVVADGRYEPQNFPFFHIDDSELVWDFGTSLSNYTTLRTQHAADLKGKGWEIESSINLNQNTISNIIRSGGQNYGYGGGAPTASASDDYLPVTSSSSSSGADAGAPSDDGGAEAGSTTTTVEQTADQVREADIRALFAGVAGPNVRITRMRSDISHEAMNVDFVLRASEDQSEVSNQRIVTKSVNLVCPTYNGCGVLGGCDQSSGPPTGSGILAAVAAALGLAGMRLIGVRRRRNTRA
jgi:hypothetical protein